MINKKIMTLSPPRAMKLLSYNYAEKSPSLQTVTGFCLASVAAPADEYIRPMGPQPVRTFFSLNGPRLVCAFCGLMYNVSSCYGLGLKAQCYNVAQEEASLSVLFLPQRNYQDGNLLSFIVLLNGL